MSANFSSNIGLNPANVVYNPQINCPQQPVFVPVVNPFQQLPQDTFVKNTEKQDKEKSYTQKTLKEYMGASSVSDLQSKLRKKKSDLDFNKKMLRDYPNNPKYAREIDKLEKEIRDLESQIAKHC